MVKSLSTRWVGGRAWLCLVVAWMAPAWASDTIPAQVGPYDFAYRITGSTIARPLQVFDDGIGKTYFQFARDQPVPLILVGAGPDKVKPVQDGPYQVVEGRARQYRLVFGGRVARVEHASLLRALDDSAALDAFPARARAGAAPGRDGGPPTFHPSDRTQSSYATPTRGDVIAWTEPPREVAQGIDFGKGLADIPRDARRRIVALRSQLGPEVAVRIVVAHPDALSVRRTAAVHRTLRDAGVPSERISITTEQPAGTGIEPLVPHGLPSLRLWWMAPGLTAAGGMALEAVNTPPQTRNVSSPPASAASAGSPANPPAAVRRAAPVPPLATPQQPAPGHPAEASHDRLPIPAPAPDAMPGVFGRPVANNFDILTSDLTVAATLRRWAARSGYRIEWLSPLDAPITGEMTLDVNGFPDAVDRVIAGLRASGYPLTSDTPAEKVVRISSTQ